MNTARNEAHENTPRRLGRREFLTRTLAGALVLGLSFEKETAAFVVGEEPAAKLPADFALNAFLRIDTDGAVTIIAKHDEMGQGIFTGLAMAVCEELEVPLSRVEVVPAPPDPRYGNLVYGLQLTGGSTSTWSSFEQMRKAGATAREMLLSAAATMMGVDRDQLAAKDGAVRTRDGSDGRTYGQLAAAAAKLDAPSDVALKDPSEFRIVGKPTPRVDSPAKVRGTAMFGLDKTRPGMLTALVARAPSFGADVSSFDATAAEKVRGVRKVVRVPSGVAVIAEGYWPAFKGREALDVTWTAGAGEALDSADLRRIYEEKSRTPGMVARSDGDVDAALRDAETVIEGTYEVPFQAHAPMETLNCLVTLRDDGGAEIVTGSQMLGADHPAVAARLGVDPSRVTFENSLLGGGFGRRANPKSDFVLEAVEVALAAKDLGAPIKTVWSREDDLRGGWYRPMFVNHVVAGLADGKISGWRHRVVGQSIAAGTAFESLAVRDGVDTLSVEGAADMPHGIPNLRVELHTMSLPVPVQWWRSVGHSNTAFPKEAFLDECAEKLGRDPYELRRELLADHPRWLRVLDLVAEKAGWGGPLPEGRGRGIAVHESFKGFAAHVVEASIEDGRPRIHRIVCAIDCGRVVNPDQVEAQMQSAAVFALSATLGSGITFAGGRVEQSNFHDFQLVRMHEAPSVEVHIVESDEPMGGIGEVGVPPLAPATCSALRAAGGPRIRRLPVADQLA